MCLLRGKDWVLIYNSDYFLCLKGYGIAKENSPVMSPMFMYHQFNIQQFYVLPTQSIYVFCMDLRTNSDYFPIQHQLTGFYNRDGLYLLRGTDWRFTSLKPSGNYMHHHFNIEQFYVLPTQCIYVFCVDLRTNSDYFPIQH